MPGGLKVKFQEFEYGELKSKFSRALESCQKFKISNKEEALASSCLMNIEENKLHFDLNFESTADTIVLSFELDGMTYFFEAQKQNSDPLIVSLPEKVFRSEKRVNERLITFPGRKIYINFETEKEVDGNVLSFQAHKNDDLKFLKEFAKSRDGIATFRITDISKEGLSFFINKNEEDFFQSHYRKQIDVEAVIEGEGLFENLNKVEVAYVIDYVNPRAVKAPMKKVGVKFQENERINELLEGLLDSGEILTNLEEQFHVFLNVPDEE